mgnify:CR=1 FL=1
MKLGTINGTFRRDEDGKTPLDKARERNDEGHREVSELIVSSVLKVFGFIFFMATFLDKKIEIKKKHM